MNFHTGKWDVIESFETIYKWEEVPKSFLKIFKWTEDRCLDKSGEPVQLRSALDYARTLWRKEPQTGNKGEALSVRVVRVTTYWSDMNNDHWESDTVVWKNGGFTQ